MSKPNVDFISTAIANSNICCLTGLQRSPYSLLASGDENGSIIIWNTETKEILWNLKRAHESCIKCFKEFLDGTLASGSEDKTIKIWNLEKGELLQTLSGHSGYVMTLEQMSDSLVSGSMDMTIKIWNNNNIDKKTSWQILRNIEVYLFFDEKSPNAGSCVRQLLMLSNGDLVIGCMAVIIVNQNNLLNFDKSRVNLFRKIECGNYSKLAVLRDMDGDLVVGHDDSKITIWNTMNCKCLRKISLNPENIPLIQVVSVILF